MKTWLRVGCVGLLLGSTSAATFGQGAPADQIKRRARNVAEQNNARQGVPPPAPPKSAATQRPAATVPAAPQLTPQQKAVTSIRGELASLATTNSATVRKRLSQSLLAAARGPGKPTGAATEQLGESLAAAMAGAKFDARQLDRLAQNLDGAMNSSGMAKSQTDAIADDVKAVLEKAGGGSRAASTVANGLKGITAEIRKAAGR